MEAIDKANRRFGRGSVVHGKEGVPDRRKRSTKFEMRAPRYTTGGELPSVGRQIGL